MSRCRFDILMTVIALCARWGEVIRPIIGILHIYHPHFLSCLWRPCNSIWIIELPGEPLVRNSNNQVTQSICSRRYKSTLFQHTDGLAVQRASASAWSHVIRSLISLLGYSCYSSLFQVCDAWDPGPSLYVLSCAVYVLSCLPLLTMV